MSIRCKLGLHDYVDRYRYSTGGFIALPKGQRGFVDIIALKDGGHAILERYCVRCKGVKLGKGL